MNQPQSNDVLILMAAYNCHKYIEEQVESIRAQAGVNWRLTVRDDGSGGATPGIIHRLASKDDRIESIEDAHGNLGVCGNFALLALRAQSDGCSYLAFADQDDYWLPGKLLRQLELMRKMEYENPGAPILVYSDLEVVDSRLTPIAPSFMRYQGIRHEENSPLDVLLAQNFVIGCTMLVNKPLLDLALPVPEEVLMHDWWFALCAATCGRIGFVDMPLVKYRQHGDNEVGAKSVKSMLNPLRILWFRQWRAGRDNLFASMDQAVALAERLRDRSDAFPGAAQHLWLIDGYATLTGLPPLDRLRQLRRLGVRSQSCMRRTLLYSRLLLA
ncbi:glycosyltransferase family 2 protein [Pseudomonadota bacterium]